MNEQEYICNDIHQVRQRDTTGMTAAEYAHQVQHTLKRVKKAKLHTSCIYIYIYPSSQIFMFFVMEFLCFLQGFVCCVAFGEGYLSNCPTLILRWVHQLVRRSF